MHDSTKQRTICYHAKKKKMVSIEKMDELDEKPIIKRGRRRRGKRTNIEDGIEINDVVIRGDGINEPVGIQSSVEKT